MPWQGSQASGHQAELIEFALSSQERLDAIAAHVCQISTDGGGHGTGVLVGPDLVMTNYHVLGRMTTATAREGVTFTFHSPLDDRFRLSQVLYESRATHFELDKEAKTDRPAEIDQLDFVIARIVPAPDPSRGWTPLPQSPPSISEPPPHLHLRILGFNSGAVELECYEGWVVASQSSGRRIIHDAPTFEGSSGSPCLDDDGQIVALNNAGGGRDAWRGVALKRAIPAALILNALRTQPQGCRTPMTGDAIAEAITQTPPVRGDATQSFPVTQPLIDDASSAHLGVLADVRAGRFGLALTATAEATDPKSAELRSLAVEGRCEPAAALHILDEAFARPLTSRDSAYVAWAKLRLLERSGQHAEALSWIAEQDSSLMELEPAGPLERALIEKRLGEKGRPVERPPTAFLRDPNRGAAALRARPDLWLQFAVTTGRGSPGLVQQALAAVGAGHLPRHLARPIARGLTMAQHARSHVEVSKSRFRSDEARWLGFLQTASLFDDPRMQEIDLLTHPTVHRHLTALARRWAMGRLPYYREIHGRADFTNGDQTGSHFRFRPDHMSDVDEIAGVWTRPGTDDTIGVTLEGCIAPAVVAGDFVQPLHGAMRDAMVCRLLRRHSIPAHSPKHPLRQRVTLFARTADPHGRLMAYVFDDRPAGTLWQMLSTDDVARSVNAELLLHGIAYPDLTTSMPAVHRSVLVEAAREAERERRNVWKLDSTTTPFPIHRRELTSSRLVHPRLFLLCMDFLNARSHNHRLQIMDWLATNRTFWQSNRAIQGPDRRRLLTDVLTYDHRKLSVDEFDSTNVVFVDEALPEDLVYPCGKEWVAQT